MAFLFTWMTKTSGSLGKRLPPLENASITRERRAGACINSIYNAERLQRNELPGVTHELTIRRSNALRHSSHSSDLMYTICEHTNTRDASERREPFYFTVRSFFSCLPPLPTIQVRPGLNIVISPLSFPSSSCAASEALPFALTGTIMESNPCATRHARKTRCGIRA